MIYTLKRHEKIVLNQSLSSNAAYSDLPLYIRVCLRRQVCNSVHSIMIMPRCACASEVYSSVFVCVCLCRLLQLLKDESSASKSSYRLLVMFTWILIRGFASFSSCPNFA